MADDEFSRKSEPRSRTSSGKKRTWLKWTVLWLVVLAIAGIGFSAALFSSWSELRTVSPEKADRMFSKAVESAGGGPAYLEISEEVRVRRELEQPDPTELETLHLVAWDPDKGKLLETDFPFWFVRVKMSDSLNLGTLASVLSRDWDRFDLKVSVEELERLGQGLVLDHRLESGARILLWTEAKKP